MTDNLESSTLLPVKLHTGILYKEVKKRTALSLLGTENTVNTPIYYVEYLEDPYGLDTVTIFQPKIVEGVVTKAFNVKELSVGYNTGSILGQLAGDLKPKKSQIEYVDSPPLYVAILDKGRDTLTDEYGLGFYDRVPDRITADGNIKEGVPTGVFITLSSIKWIKTVVPTGPILEDKLNIRRAWFDF